MPSQRITMRKIREVLRLRFECKLSLDTIARALSLSKGAVAKYIAGHTLPITDASTGEIRPTQLFVAVLGASN